MVLTTGDNYIYLTLTESIEYPNDTNKRYQLSFIGESNERKSCFLSTNLSNYKIRYDKYLIKLVSNPTNNSNEIDLKKGSYYYTVTFLSAERPQGIIIERGWADVVVNSDNYLVNSPITTYTVNA